MVSSANTASEVKQMSNHTDQDIIRSSPELALLVFALVAVFVYVLF
jgi:hypothetical protein